ncbi:phage major capsid protein [Xenorhabdus griffiniae]|uniref:Phage major capsid protein n=1 Tax=Xenorhabdus griffiniae TaxID=351672 RepID=A0ABY9XFF6_9GAMM|nr:phage major capsid protein [Xenorhabdus griffiniae]MBD1229125.1 phage major capsid protein [Xenorhabdus griffiniae]MBE8588944.1 phage major capsid protein [Xenorhabdus griffiniae]WMV70963.1 phage major capsid protein [Xenorhabdus griffiniae]WMV71662.1 phage major capsid protein [Xenorhabdus griffiniae]WNH00639.1 phage major capsid protein [Xenorhabdus griffiniae]
MKLHELKQRRNTIATEMRALHEKIGDNAWTEEQRTEWNKAKTELDTLNEQIQREESLRSLDQQLVDNTEPEQRKQPTHPETEQQERRAAAFDKFLRHGLGEMTAEERQALRELRAQGVSPDEKGGYTVPTQMLNKVVEAMKAYGGIASVAQILSTSTGQTIEWATADGTTEEGELLGENTAASEEDTTFGTDSLGAKKLSSKIIRVSNELLQDSGIDMEAYLAKRIAQRIGRGEARYLVKGTGTGSPQQPKGLETSVTGTVDAAAKFSWKDMNALKHALDPAYRNVGTFRWAFNDSTLKLITEMEDAQGRPLWLPEIAGVVPSTVLGVPYVIDQAIADMGAGKKFIYCGDFNRFIVRRVAYMTLKRLVERYAEYDQTAFLAFHRFDCILEDTAAIKALIGKGTASAG